MDKKKFENFLLSLRPDDLKHDFSDQLTRFKHDIPDAEKKLQAELHYLRLVSSDQVELPDDLYFAHVREKIFQRVEIKPVTFLSRIRNLLLPEMYKPIPGFLADTVLLVPGLIKPIPAIIIGTLLVTTLLFAVISYPWMGKQIEPIVYQEYIPLSEIYATEVSKPSGGQLQKQEYREYLEIFLKAGAIIGSPSSLSRSQTLGFGLK